MQKEEIKKLLHNFWQRSSDACPLEATEAERQEKEFEKYIESLPESSRPSLDIDKVVEQLREANHYESWPNKRIWNQACDELQKILNQKEGK